MNTRGFVTWAALIGNASIMLCKFVAAIAGGSASLLAEALHSVADTGDSVFLLIGQKRMQKPPDELHPFGYGKELYFWTLIVSVSFFSIGGVGSIFEGISRVVKPEPLEDPKWSYIVLVISFVFTAVTAGIAFKEFRAAMKPGQSYWESFQSQKDPTIFMVLFEDSASLIGNVIAFLGIWLGHLLHNRYLDGIASIAIGLLLTFVALMLINETKKLLVGERADPEMLESIKQIAGQDQAVAHVGDIRTSHLSPEDALVIIDTNFHPDLKASEVAAACDRIAHAIRDKHPEAKHVYLDPQPEKGERDPETEERDGNV